MSSDLRPICSFDVDADGTTRPTEDTGTTPPKGVAYRWLHIDQSDPAFPAWTAEELPGVAGQSLLAVETRPRIDALGDGLILSLRGVNLNEGAEVEDMISLRMWVTPQLIITVRRRRIFAVDDLRRRAEDGQAPATVADFLDALSDGLIDRIEQVSLGLDETTDDMETAVYDHGHDHQTDLAPLRRKVIKLRRHLGPQLDALYALARIESAVIPKKMRPRLHENANRAARSFEELTEVRERLNALSEHLDLTQTARLGRNSFTLSVVAAIFLPISFLTGLLGVNLAGIPGADHPHAFLYFLGGLAVIGVVLWLLLRRRRWL